MPTWPSPVLSSGFTYVSDSEPTAPEEGETWYDTNANEAKVYDGVSWLKLTVTDHAELGSVSAGQHRSDSNVRATVDGAVDADTVDGQHASELGGATITGVFRHYVSDGSTSDRTYTVWDGNGDRFIPIYANTGKNGLDEWSKYVLYFADGSSESYKGTTHDFYNVSAPVERIDLSERNSAGPNRIYGFVFNQ